MVTTILSWWNLKSGLLRRTVDVLEVVDDDRREFIIEEHAGNSRGDMVRKCRIVFPCGADDLQHEVAAKARQMALDLISPDPIDENLVYFGVPAGAR